MLFYFHCRIVMQRGTSYCLAIYSITESVTRFSREPNTLSQLCHSVTTEAQERLGDLCAVESLIISMLEDECGSVRKAATFADTACDGQPSPNGLSRIFIVM